MGTNCTELKLCCGAVTTVGYSKRTQIKNATAAACAPLLKTNSVQGVFGLGSMENMVDEEAEELISASLVTVKNASLLKHLLGDESFSTGQHWIFGGLPVFYYST